uniref:Acin depolymerizing factor 2 n=1 Tax=Griffithsia japonica TaxID=83288 RepID=Q7XZ10_GRIJA|nr:acin depolymerizing factor 2 [Griffithsia japonica]
MVSGVPINPAVIEKYNEISKRTCGAMILSLAKPNNDEVIVDQAFPPTTPDSDPEDIWKKILEQVPDEDCRYIIVDFKVKTTPTVSQEKVTLVYWAPETAPSRSKMIYAATKEHISSSLNGVQSRCSATTLTNLLCRHQGKGALQIKPASVLMLV